MSDLISRQAAIKAIEGLPNCYNGFSDTYDKACIIGVIEELPSAQERKTGRWIDCIGSDHWKCSECGDRAPMYWDANRQEYDEWYSPFCPNCGAKMEVTE